MFSYQDINMNNWRRNQIPLKTNHRVLTVSQWRTTVRSLPLQMMMMDQHHLPNSNAESNQLDERNDANLDVSDDSMPLDEYDNNDDYATSDILQSFNSSELKYVQPIMDEMERHGNILKWDKHTGEILFQLKKISDSNIIELLKDTLTASLHPTGKMEFYRGLDMMNIQTKYIKHSKNKALLNILRGKKKIMETKNVVQKKKIKRMKLNTNNNSRWISWM